MAARGPIALFHEILLGIDLLVAIAPGHAETGGFAMVRAAKPGRDRRLPKDLADRRDSEPRPWLKVAAEGGDVCAACELRDDKSKDAAVGVFAAEGTALLPHHRGLSDDDLDSRDRAKGRPLLRGLSSYAVYMCAPAWLRPAEACMRPTCCGPT